MPLGTNNSIIKGCGCHHIAIQTRDWEASLRLYRDVLGMPVTAAGGTPERPMCLLDIGDGSHIELFAPTEDTPAVGSPAPNDPVIHFALATEDVRAATEHVRQAGYEITVEPREAAIGSLPITVSFFRGPNGELLEFFQTR